MRSESESSASSTTTTPQVAALSAEVGTIKSQLAELLSAFQSSGLRQSPDPNAGHTAAAPAIAEPSAAAPAVAGASAGSEPSQPADPVTELHFALPPPISKAISDAQALKQAYAESGQLCHFEKARTLPPYPAEKFIPEPKRLFGRIKAADTRDGYKAEVLWNLGHNSESSLAAAHQVAECLATGDISGATAAFSLVHHYLQANYERVQEPVEFFSYSLESGKTEAILLQKYLREEDQPYTSALYRNTKRQFADLWAKAFAKELNTHAAKPSDRRGKGRNGRESHHE